MTIDEAIQELKDASDSEVRYGDTDHHYDEVMKRIEAFDMAIKALEQQPSQPTRPKGKIIHKAPYGWGYCSECNGVVEPQDRFCSFCGAKMEVEE